MAREAAAKAKREAEEAEMKAAAAREAAQQAAREAAQAEREAAEQAASAAQEERESSADQILEPMALAVVHATDPIQQTTPAKRYCSSFLKLLIHVPIFYFFTGHYSKIRKHPRK